MQCIHKKYKPSHHESGDGLGLENAFTVAARSRHCRYHTRAAAAFYTCTLGLVYNTYQTRKKREGRGKREMGKREKGKKKPRKGFIID